jgi:hypothetical protein
VRPLEAMYERTRARIVHLIRQACDETTGAAAAILPACPSWSVRDVVAHMTGVCTDVMSGNVQEPASDRWTAAQVRARRAMRIDEVLCEWDDVGPKFAAIIDDFPGRHGDQVIADLAVHEQDIRGAVGWPGARESSAVALGTEFLLGAVVGPGAKALGVGPLEMRVGQRSWIVGTGGPASGDPKAAIEAALLSTESDGVPDVSSSDRITADPFEVFRAVTGRRSERQIRRFQWSSDPEPYLALFDLWPFTMRTTDLVE